MSFGLRRRAPHLAQTIAVKRAQVAFHNFASMGEPEKALAKYSAENARRAAILDANRDFVGSMTPFLEVGANVGHTSYLFANTFQSQGFALDISADALRFGQALPAIFGWSRRPFLVAGDALRLPFRDGSLRLVATFQTLSQFQDIQPVLAEIARVLQPGGIFYLAEEPIRRRLTLRLRRVPYVEQMKPWEIALHRHGWLDFIARDVIGAEQEESFGIRQNHRHGLGAWRAILCRHFTDLRFVTFARESGWANERAARAIRRFGSDSTVASMLGGTFAAFCRKPGDPPRGDPSPLLDCLACPDCGRPLDRAMDAAAFHCTGCPFFAPLDGGVLNLLPGQLREELFPSQWRPDTLDFSKQEHEQGLIAGFYQLEGENGARFRWMGPRAAVRLRKTRPGPENLRIRGFAHANQFLHGQPTLRLTANGHALGDFKIKRHGLFVIETPVPDAPEYLVDIAGSPVWRPEDEDRNLTITVSMIRLLPRE